MTLDILHREQRLQEEDTMRTLRVSLGVAVSLLLLALPGCLQSEPTDATEAQALAEPEASASESGVTPRLLTEEARFVCPGNTFLFLTREECQASCTTSCRLRLACFDSQGQQVACP